VKEAREVRLSQPFGGWSPSEPSPIDSSSDRANSVVTTEDQLALYLAAGQVSKIRESIFGPAAEGVDDWGL
jgi:hypothetical protein